MALPTPIGRQKEVLALPAEGHHVVLGTAGSGKTTIAILRSAFLSNPRTDHAGRTLLVTFNRTLVTYLEFIGGNALRNVALENYHLFARGYLRSRGVELSGAIVNDDGRRDLIGQALSRIRQTRKGDILEHNVDFFEEELRWIAQNGIRSRDEYQESARKTRHKPLDEHAREMAWDVHEAYKAIRESRGKQFDWHDIAMAASEHLRADNSPRLYKHVVVDEGQDLSPEMIRSLALADRELTVYAVTGWARSWHIENGPTGDLDWHIELTQTAKTMPSKCVVVEIPDPQYGAIFATARQDFLDLIVNSTVNTKKQIVPPVRVTVVGPAFFDAQHRGAKGSGKPPSGHGHCNTSDRALWEIHPVYEVRQP